MSTSTSLIKRNNEIMVKISNNVIDIKKCIQTGYESNFRFKSVVKYRGDFYIIFVGSGIFPEYSSKYFHEMDPKDFDDNMKLKRATYIGDDNFIGFAMTGKTLDMYVRSISGSAGIEESDDSDSESSCECCKAYVWKVEVPNNKEKIKKLLRIVLCHTDNNPLPIAIYYKDDKYYIMFKTNGTDPIACVSNGGFDNVIFSSRESDGIRITPRNHMKFAMKHTEFWDYVEDQIMEYKKRKERDERDICE